MREELMQQWREATGPQTPGWDFSALDAVMSEDPAPWDLDAEYRAALAGAAHVLDMGTGGGEHLLRFASALPADTTATEGWAPNVPVARSALADIGVPVVEFGAPDDDPDSVAMPFPDERFDLVLNRHESYSPGEVARVLMPGGVLLTQQVGSGELHELHELLDWEPVDLDVTLERFAAEAEAAGLVIERADRFEGSYRFADVTALIRYLRKVPWDAPADFSVERHADALLRLHEQNDGELALTLRRFRLCARRPL
ncbi:methyltransferase domain-containing protein [Microbacterium sp. ARD32]|uniref:class I SAM-dependent methyltransferase n=1 Tax=Microbacterium sp. ARD32 TaxID=2962577 RepID=UPI00288192AD|nr:methyltransferase domain-containing protein [Microbacterium sp. ARD32]MDT0156892.1 methyltransferase domain-containing protein [Microbacterium sp. ARD32]